MANKKSIEYLVKFLGNIANEGRFDKCLSQVQIISGGDGNLIAKLKIDKEHTNVSGYLHGGFTATLVDSLSSFGLLTHPNTENSGVSVDMSISYLSAAPLGEEILIKSIANKVGKKLAFLSVEISRESTGEIIAKGSHTKYLLPSKGPKDSKL